MAKTERVFLVDASSEKGRPVIDFSLPENGRNDWLLVGQVLRGEREEKDYPNVLIFVHHPEAVNWDMYFGGGNFGLMSERAVDLLEPYASDYFKFFQARLNGESFFFLKRKRVLDCLDPERSILVPFRCDPTGIKEIKRYRFHMDRIADPLVFTIPETPELFATQSIDSLIRGEGL